MTAIDSLIESIKTDIDRTDTKEMEKLLGKKSCASKLSALRHFLARAELHRDLYKEMFEEREKK